MNLSKLLLLAGGLFSMAFPGTPKAAAQPAGLFLHTDRDVYSPADPLRFSAFAPGPDSDRGGLRVLVINMQGKPVSERLCPMDGSRVADSLWLPDTLREGEYRLIAWTGAMEKGNPGDAWTKKIMVRKRAMPGLLVSIKPDAAKYEKGDQAMLAIRITTIDGKPAAKAQFLYLATKNGIPYQNGIGITDENGDAVQPVRIPFTEEEGLIAVSINTESGSLKGSALTELPGAKGFIAPSALTVRTGPPSQGSRESAIVFNEETGKGKGKDFGGFGFTVNGPNGTPVAATLSVSVYDGVMSPAWQPAAVEFKPAAGGEGLPFRERVIRHFTPGPQEQFMAQFRLENFFTACFMEPPSDLAAFLRTNKPFLQETGILPGKPTQDDRIRQQLEIGVPILSVIRSIKPYTLTNGQLFFSKGKNSLEYPKGALIIVDGVEKGYNAEALSYISPMDVQSIRISEKISEILKYSADACGLVLITTKNGQPAQTVSKGLEGQGYDPTLYWNPDVKTDGKAPVHIILPKLPLRSNWVVVVCGTDVEGNKVEAVKEFRLALR